MFTHALRGIGGHRVAMRSTTLAMKPINSIPMAGSKPVSSSDPKAKTAGL
jgi:hypothetical protein